MTIEMGPFAHTPDGEIGDIELALARDVIHEFARRSAAPVGRMVSLVGIGRAKLRAASAPIAEEITGIATEIWVRLFGSEPGWKHGEFAEDVIDIIEAQASGPSFHFGDAALKELEIAHVFDLIVQHMEIQVIGGRCDIIAHWRTLRPDTAGRDRRILRGERPFTGLAIALSPDMAPRHPILDYIEDIEEDINSMMVASARKNFPDFEP